MKSSIFVVLVIVTLVQALSVERQKKVDKDMAECVQETGITAFNISEVVQGKLPENEKVKEWALCFVKKSDYIDDAGVLQTDFIRKSAKEDLSEDFVAELIRDCVAQKSTPQETSFQYFKCVLKLAKKHNL